MQRKGNLGKHRTDRYDDKVKGGEREKALGLGRWRMRRREVVLTLEG